MGFNGNTLDGMNESYTNDSLGQTSVRTVTEVRNSSGVPVDPATEDKQDAIITDLESVIASGYTQTPTGKLVRVQIGPGDIISNIPIVTLFEHHQIHEGEAWEVNYPPTALANNASINFRIVVGNQVATKGTPHLLFLLDTTGESWCYLYETPTTTGNGTPMIANNRNRNIAGSPVTTFFSAPTVTSPGTLLTSAIAGSGEKAGGSSREANEWDLKANTVYLFRVTAKNANNVAVRFQWYEDLGV